MRHLYYRDSYDGVHQDRTEGRQGVPARVFVPDGLHRRHRARVPDSLSGRSARSWLSR
jgi:hypothetical protein